MYIILSHSGTDVTTRLAKEIADMLEDDGNTTEQVISDESNHVTLYDGDYNVIATFDKVPDESTLRFFIDINDDKN